MDFIRLFKMVPMMSGETRRTSASQKMAEPIVRKNASIEWVVLTLKEYLLHDTTNAIKKKRRKWSNFRRAYTVFACKKEAFLDATEKQVVLSSVSESEVSSIRYTMSFDTPRTISRDNAHKRSVIVEHDKHVISCKTLGPGTEGTPDLVAGAKLKLSRYCESWLLPLASISKPQN